MCIRDRVHVDAAEFAFFVGVGEAGQAVADAAFDVAAFLDGVKAVSYTHLRAHETVLDLVCRLLLEKKK
mgnify:CR=1 FL=1